MNVVLRAELRQLSRGTAPRARLVLLTLAMRSRLWTVLALAAVAGCSQQSLDKGAVPQPDGSLASPDARVDSRDAQVDSQDAQVDSGVLCQDSGWSLVPAARACSADTDCSILSARSCCSLTSIGVATAHEQGYGACLPPSCNQTQYECFPEYSFFTDSGDLTATDPGFSTVLQRGATVACVQGLCTTTFAAPDAGATP
jgi:hypothetical protein